MFGVVAYLLPLLIAVFGAAYLFGFLHYLRERLQWSLLWSVGLLVSLTGLLFLADRGGILGRLHESIGANSAGGGLGYLSYGESARYQWGFSLLGPIGATIVYAALCLVCVIFLTAFQLGDWLRNRMAGVNAPKSTTTSNTATTPEEALLERKARDLQKQAKKLQEEVERNGTANAPASASGIGADLKPVPEPTVRDLSMSQSKARARKSPLATGAGERTCRPGSGGSDSRSRNYRSYDRGSFRQTCGNQTR